MVYVTESQPPSDPVPFGGPASARRFADVRGRFNGFLFPADPYLPPAVGLMVGVPLLMFDMVSAEAPLFLRVSALLGSLLLITDSASALRRAFARSDDAPAVDEPEPHESVAPQAGDLNAVPLAYNPPPPPAAPIEPVPLEPVNRRRMGNDNPAALAALVIAVALGLAALGPSTTSMRLLSMATTILICVRVYDAVGPRRG